MKIQSINNNQYNNKPSFGAIKVAKSVKNEYLKEIVENPEFSKLAKQLEEKGKDLLIKQDLYDFGLSYKHRIRLQAKKEGFFSLPEPIAVISPFDHISNTLENALKAFSVEKLSAKKEVPIKEKVERDMLIKKLNSLNESIAIPKPIEKKNFIQRLLGL